MKIDIDKNKLIEKIGFAARFVSLKLSSTPGLQGVYLKGEKNLLHFYSTNLYSYYHTSLKIEGVNKVEAIIEPKKLLEFLSLLSAGKVEVEIKEKNITVCQGKTKGEFPVIISDEFPLPPKIEDKPQKIKKKFFFENLPLVLFAASSDETRPVLTGVNFISQDEELNIVSTDGFRLSLLKLKKEVNLPSMIVPSSFLSEIVQLIKEEGEISVSYSDSEKTIGFYIDEHELFSRLIEGEYPPFEKVIPSEKKTTVEIDKEEFLRNIRLTAIFARELSNIIVIQVTKEGVFLRPKTEKNEENITFIETAVVGDEQKVAFNFRFLVDFLNHLEASHVVFEILRPDSPVVFRSDKNPNFLHIIMPVRIQE